jgi:exoribonuclease-2
VRNRDARFEAWARSSPIFVAHELRDSIDEIRMPQSTSAMSRAHHRINLYEVAADVVRDAGFITPPPESVLAELDAFEGIAVAEQPQEGITDMRHLPWCSIDNDDSRDLDQIQCAERLDGECIRLLVGIADVDSLVGNGSATDGYAGHNATSVYTGVRTFPMLPDELSEGMTSLLPGVDRYAVVVGLTLDGKGEVVACETWRALVRNQAKLVYEPIGTWLERGGTAPASVAEVPGLTEQVLLQYEATERIQRYREAHGALNLETIEARPVAKEGKIVDLVVREDNAARELIENLMVAANNAVAEYLRSRGVPVIQRVVREPERWPQIVRLAARYGAELPETPSSGALTAFLEKQRRADPVRFPDLSLSVVKLLGAAEYDVVPPGEETPEHFGLALRGYSRSTAPNRRYVDLVTQRMLKAIVAGRPQPYSVEELDVIIEHCREMERQARKVERRVRKMGAAILLADRVGEEFRAIVTGVSPKGTYVRLLSPPAEGRVVSRYEGMDIGEKVRVRLVGTDPGRGFIDFEGI